MAGGIDWTLIGHSRRVEVLAAIRRQRAELDARETQLLAVMAADPLPGIDGHPAMNKQWVREDVACALRISPGAAAGKLQAAHQLASRLPATVEAMRAGRIDLGYARRLADATYALPADVASEVESQVLDRAQAQTLTQFSGSVRRAVLAADPRGADKRHADAVDQRRVVFTPQDDGMTELWALLPADQAATLHGRIQHLAQRMAGQDERTADQRRADALCALGVDATAGAQPGPSVHVVVALSTLLHLDDQPADLEGHGAVPAALARAIAFDPTATWRRLITDKCGQIVDHGRGTYRPPARLERLVIARDVQCTFPGCPRTARRCELDHLLAWADGGTTSADNLHPLCPRHHHLKHETAWRVTRAADGTTTWISPAKLSYTRPPPERPVDRTAAARQPVDPDESPPF